MNSAEAQDCTKPPTIHKGKDPLLKIDNDGQTAWAVYTCMDGYQLHGTAEVFCDVDNDIWLGDLPVCKLGKVECESMF